MNPQSVKKLLANQSRDELIKIIAMLSYDNDAEEWLLDYCKKKGSTGCARLLAEEQVLHQWFIAEEAIEEVNEYGDSYHLDDAFDALVEIAKIAGKNKLTWKFRQPIVDKLVKQLFEDNRNLNDELFECAEKLCQDKKEIRYLAEKLGASSSGYLLRRAARLYLKCGEKNLFVKLYSQNLRSAKDYVFLADYYKENKEPEKAIQTAEEALNIPYANLDTVYEWLFKEYKRKKEENNILALYRFACDSNRSIETMTQLMIEYYAANPGKRKPYLLKMAEVCYGDDAVKWFKKCRQVLTPAEFKKHSARLYRFLREKNLHDYLQVRIDEGEYKEVLDCLKALPVGGFEMSRVDCNHSLTKQLTEFCPEEIVSMYWNEAESLCRVSDKKNYAQAASILGEIKTICRKAQMRDIWVRDFDQFLMKHRKKARLMEMVSPLKRR